MTDEQRCIIDLYTLVEEITEKAEKRDFSIVRPKSSIGGTYIYHGAPPIRIILDKLLDEHGDAIYQALKQKEIDDTPIF